MKQSNLRLLIAGILLLIISLSGLLAPLQGVAVQVATGLVSPLTSLVQDLKQNLEFFQHLGEIEDENRQLLAERNDLLAEVTALKTKLETKEYLATQDWLQDIPGTKLAKILRYSYSPQVGYVYALSEYAQVKVGDYAVSEGYIVGQVAQVWGSLINVRLTYASDTRLQVKVGQRDILAELGGDGVALPVLTNVSEADRVKKDDPVRLLSPANPALEALSLGQLVEISGDPADAVKGAKLNVPVQLTALERIIIVPQDVAK